MTARSILIILIGVYIGATLPVIIGATAKRLGATTADDRTTRIMQNILTESKKCTSNPCKIDFDKIMDGVNETPQ